MRTETGRIMNILDKIITDTKKQLVERKKLNSILKVKRIAEEKAQNKTPHRFRDSLVSDNMAIIAEVKKASPSKGVICEHFYPLFFAKQYEQGGAAAISVLTEELYFQGHLNYLYEISEFIGLPTLRKDFIVDEYQIYEAVNHSASAILLIVAALDPQQISELLQLAGSMNLDALVEVHDEKELEIAVKADASIIGVNNRNLETFETTLETSKRLSDMMPKETIRVSESGIFTREDIVMLQEAGFNAALIGESLMKKPDKESFLNELKGINHVD